MGIYQFNIITCCVSSLGVILCGSYSLWLYNRLIFGNLKLNYTLSFIDLNIREFSVLLPLLVFVFIGGLYPYLFSSFVDINIIDLYFVNI
jgi:NADH-quinone oxidoreductase subunit M